MESNLIITAWVVITLLYTATHHLYNWISRVTTCEDDEDIRLQLIFGAIYVSINIAYFTFTFHAFKYFWKLLKNSRIGH